MQTAIMGVDTASILKQCFDALNQAKTPPTGLLIGLDIIRRKLADIGQIVITSESMTHENVELLQALLELGIIRMKKESETS